jgi:hypothetical protein
MKTLPPPQEKSVFEQVKKERSSSKADPRDIIKADVEKTGGDFNQVYSKLVASAQRENTDYA